MFGSVLPLAEVALGSPNILHTPVGSVLALTLVMIVSWGRPLRRRSLIGIPIGMFLHLVLDASWTRSSLFWWPVTSGGFATGSIPEVDRPLPVWLLLEALGGIALVWAWQRFGLDDAAPRRTFFRTGQMDRSVARHGPGGGASVEGQRARGAAGRSAPGRSGTGRSGSGRARPRPGEGDSSGHKPKGEQ